MENIESLWIKYAQTKDITIREKIIIHYASLVKIVAGRLSIHMGQFVDYDDLLSYGIFGLIDAIDRFDYTKGIKFESYASLRIRGEIIDQVRKLDWIPRSIRQKSKEIENLYTQMERELGRVPTDDEMATKLQVSLKKFHDILKKVNFLSLISLEEFIENNHEAASKIASTEYIPEESLYYKELKKLLFDEIEKLTDQEKKVITLYYFEELNLKEISKVLNVSESRISQIHSKAMLKLKSKLGDNRYFLYT